jgi:hypothetical protein
VIERLVLFPQGIYGRNEAMKKIKGGNEEVDDLSRGQNTTERYSYLKFSSHLNK